MRQELGTNAYCYAIQPTEGKQRIYQARDETDNIAVPARLVHPGPKNKCAIIVGRRCRGHCDRDYKPC